MELRAAILKTVSYSDIFDYPLTLEEIFRFLVSSKDVKIPDLKKAIKSIQKLQRAKGFYFLTGRKKIVNERLVKEKISKNKLQIAKKISSLLFAIPTVQLIGVSGGLAMQNCNKEDDIDLFVISKKNTLWSTRLFILLLLQIFGLRRKRNEKESANKFCINMLLDENDLVLSKKRQNIYGAHEVVQLLPLFERKNTYNRFIIANNWIFSYFPNTKLKKVAGLHHTSPFTFTFLFIEPFAKFIQTLYMRKVTKEEISKNLLAFHPVDYESVVLSEYKKRLRRLSLL